MAAAAAVVAVAAVSAAAPSLAALLLPALLLAMLRWRWCAGLSTQQPLTAGHHHAAAPTARSPLAVHPPWRQRPQAEVQAS